MNESFDALMTTFPLFKGFTAHGTQRLIEQGRIIEHARGSILFNEGEAAGAVVLVLSGSLQIFVERGGKDLILTDARPGAIVGELAVLCGIPRSASVRAAEPAAVLEWTSPAFRKVLLGDVMLSQRIFGQSLRTLIDKERSLIESVVNNPDRPAST